MGIEEIMEIIEEKKPERTDETIAKQFPDRGPQPSNDIVVDETAEEAPNIGHPE